MSTILEAACHPTDAQTGGDVAHRRGRILVVEDDQSLRRLNAMMLVHSGYDVDAAGDDIAAWEALQTKRYDLLITNHNRPRLTGVELLKKLRAARMDLPLIMATGELPASELAGNPWLQPATILLKPYTVEELLGTVREVLRAVDSEYAQKKLRPDWHNQPSTVNWQA